MTILSQSVLGDCGQAREVSYSKGKIFKFCLVYRYEHLLWKINELNSKPPKIIRACIIEATGQVTSVCSTGIPKRSAIL